MSATQDTVTVAYITEDTAMVTYFASFCETFRENWMLATNTTQADVREFYQKNRIMIERMIGTIGDLDEAHPEYALCVFAVAKSAELRILRELSPAMPSKDA